MSFTVPALACHGPGEMLRRVEIERRAAGVREVVIDVRFAGICHSDIHQSGGEWGDALFPMVPGHEIAGMVSSIGAEVSTYAVGDRVGVGCYVDSCRSCTNCLRGEQQHCLRGEVATYNSVDYSGRPTFGGYSARITVDERYVLRIPDEMDLAEAAPLLCAGITVYQPLKHWRVGPGSRVAVVGLGGLGHVGVKIAHALGADVTVVSRSREKEADAFAFGASAFFSTRDAERRESIRASFDLVLNTVSAHTELTPLLDLLDLDGALINLGIPPEPEQFDAVALGAMRRSIAATKNGGIPQTQEMLDFCARHHIGASIELIDADSVNDAYRHVRDGSAPYRYVIDASTLT